MSDDKDDLRSILVGFDAQARSEHALRAALELHRALGAQLRVLHVSDIRQIPPGRDKEGDLARLWEEEARGEREHALGRLEELLKAAGLEDLSAGDLLELDSGKPPHVLARYAQERSPDVVFLGPHEKRGRLDFGSTARAVMAEGKCNIWVQPGAYKAIRRILVPIDLSEESLRALRVALQLARGLEARVTVLHTYVPPSFSYSSMAIEAQAATMTEVIEADQSLDRKGFDQVLSEIEWGDVEHDTLWLDGFPEQVILEQSKDFDLIVMGTHGRTGISATFLGNVAYGVLRHSDVPVLAVRLPRRRWLL